MVAQFFHLACQGAVRIPAPTVTALVGARKRFTHGPAIDPPSGSIHYVKSRVAHNARKRRWAPQTTRDISQRSTKSEKKWDWIDDFLFWDILRKRQNETVIKSGITSGITKPMKFKLTWLENMQKQLNNLLSGKRTAPWLCTNGLLCGAFMNCFF